MTATPTACAECPYAQQLGELVRANERLTEVNGQLQLAQDQLVQSEKLASIGQLAAGVAHEINNPVGYVFSNFGTLEKYLGDLFRMLGAYEEAEAEWAGLPSAPRLKALRDEIELEYLKDDVPQLMNESREGITRVRKIVQDLKDFSHVDARREWEWTDLHRVNAAHAISAQRGTIHVRTGVVPGAASGDEVWVEIEDNGCGISRENLGRIFDPFFTTKPVGKGTGLGLSLSYGIVQKHHGRLEVDSEPGRGTRFRVSIPVRQPEQTAA